MKKFVINGILIIFGVILMGYFGNYTFDKTSKRLEENSIGDTILIKQLVARGDQLRGSNQDSCKYFYYQAIRQMHMQEINTWTNHHIGLAYVGLAALNCNKGNYPELGYYLDSVLSIA